MRSGPGAIAAGSSRETRSLPRKPGASWICMRVSGRAGLSATPIACCRRTKRPASRRGGGNTLVCRQRRAGRCGSWTRRTTANDRRRTAHARHRRLRAHRRPISVKTMGFSLRVNHKKLAGASHPNRDDQFQRITALRQRLRRREHPDDHASIPRRRNSLARSRMPAPSGTASPNWMKDQRLSLRSRGQRSHPLRDLRSAGQYRHGLRRRDRSTPRHLPSTASKSGGCTEGRKRYFSRPKLSRSSPTAFGQRTAAPRAPAKFHLQHRLLQPPSTARDRRALGGHRRVQVEVHIEHRLFCEISKNWAGRPLEQL